MINAKDKSFFSNIKKFQFLECMLFFLNESLDLVMDSFRLLSDLFNLSTGRLPLHPTMNNRPLTKARAKKNAIS
jgi:hypothetical protein